VSTLAVAHPATISFVVRETVTRSDDAVGIDRDLAAERDLVERAREDTEAFSELYRRFLPQVHAYARRRTGSEEAAEDICSATFEAAVKNLHRFRWRPGGFAPWLMRIAANQTIAHYRREGRPSSDRGQLAMSKLHVRETIDELAFDDFTELRAAFDRLPHRYQRVLSLRYLADLDPSEAARAMGLAGPALAVVLSRARKALRRELERMEEGR
jgi:RNA polymerase sigma-70 factor (ECF subfamily)